MFGLGLVIMMIVLIILANKLMDDSVASQGKDDSGEKAAAERIQPVGKVNVGGAMAAKIDANAILTDSCMGCHGTGALGAPKVGSKADWAPRLKAGMATMLKNAMNGKGAMPAQKGAYSEKEITAAIQLMLKKSGL